MFQPHPKVHKWPSMSLRVDVGVGGNVWSWKIDIFPILQWIWSLIPSLSLSLSMFASEPPLLHHTTHHPSVHRRSRQR